MRNISSWAIRNPIPPIVLFLVLTLGGIVSFIRLDINAMPDISFPLISVSVSQPGAAPSEIEKQITQRVEGAVAGLGNVKRVTSWSREGSSETQIEFQLGTPVDRAENDVRAAIANIRSNLPGGILEPRVQRIDIEGGAIAYFAASTTDMTREQLSWFVDNTVNRQLVSIPGVAKVNRGGGVDREIRVELDPERMQAYGVTAAQVNATLMVQNVDAPGGRTEIAGGEQAVRVLGGAKTAQALAETRIPISGGRTVALRDLADVHDGFAEQRSYNKLGDREVTTFGVSKAKGASDVRVFDAVNKRLAEINKTNPNVKFELIFTTVKYTKVGYHSAMQAMIEGAVLAVIVVFLFLRDWRATAISAIAIPLSAIPTFWFMDLLGFTLNGISLLALSLVAGILVDDAIVEIENIVRHMRMGKSAYQASLEAADEIGLAVVATTFSIIVVFLPVSFMEGISGQFFKQFGLTVAIAVFISLLVARLITPMIAAYFLDSRAALKNHHEAGWVRYYLRVLHWSLVHRWKTIGLAAIAFGLTIYGFMTLPTTFQPVLNNDTSTVSISLPPGARLADTARAVEAAAAILKKQPEFKMGLEDVGGSNVNQASIYVTWLDPKDRKATSDEIEKRIAPLFAAIPDARVTFNSQRGGSGRDITLMLTGDDPVLLDRTARQLVDELRGLKTVRNPLIADDYSRPEISITPRADLAADLGVSVMDISQTIRVATLGDIDQSSARFSLNDRQIPIRVMLKGSARTDLDTIKNLPVPTARGGSVPLRVVADVKFGEGPSVIRRYNQIRRMVVGTDLAPGVETGTARKDIYAHTVMGHLPQGVREAVTGDAEFEQEFAVNALIAFASGILLVFCVLLLLYRRFFPPFINMLSLLLAPAGGVLLLHVVGWPISMPVGIGVLMLFGIVAKNSILLVDFAIEEQRAGKSKNEAIEEAGHKRAQPIVMTTVAMVAGMVPIMLNLTGDGSWRQPMALTIIGGLTLSTALTLVIVPAAYSLADDFEQWLAPRLGRLLASDRGVRHAAPAAQPAE
ncbi:MAG: efflux RND transporter permease subunit [Sphingomonadaceae bacterium]|nr:efflux RND transporter permease subunit [Sphingomonadaceae bacterium]